MCGGAVRALLSVVARDELSLGAVGYAGLLGATEAVAIPHAIILPLTASPTASIGRSAGPRADGIARRGYSGTGVLASCGKVKHGHSRRWHRMDGAHVEFQHQRTHDCLCLGPGARSHGILACLVWRDGSPQRAIGTVAELASIHPALIGAAIGLLIGPAATRRFFLRMSVELDMTSSKHWPEPSVVVEPPAVQGSVPVMVGYYRPDGARRARVSDASGALPTPSRWCQALGTVHRYGRSAALYGDVSGRI